MKRAGRSGGQAAIGALVACAASLAPLSQACAEGDARPMAGVMSTSQQAPVSVAAPPATAKAETRKILHYRNPLDLQDVSPTPKKNAFGMDFFPVCEGDESEDSALASGASPDPGSSQAPMLKAAQHSQTETPSLVAQARMAPATNTVRKVLYYLNPMGAPDTSPTPKKDAMGMDYLPVYEGDPAAAPAPSSTKSGITEVAKPMAAPSAPIPPSKEERSASAQSRKVLYYRNPMGLSDVSLTPKKDSMGMDYVPVYEGEAPRDAASVQLTPGRVQRSGIRTETVQKRVVVTPVRGFGALAYDEGAIQTVTVGVEGTIDEMFVHHVGEKVRVGQPLFRIWSSQPQLLQIEVARRAHGNADQDAGVQTALTGGQRVLNRSDWPSPATGVIIAKRVVAGSHVVATDELLRIADPTRMWVVVDVAERDLARIEPGQKAEIRLRTGAAEPLEGEVQFLFPEIKAETRTGRVCVALANPGGKLRASMYADVTIHVEADKAPSIAVPETAVVDDGVRQHVLIDQGEGRFAPRDVVTGAESDGYVELRSGVSEGERVVTSANFLIDSEANIDAALAAFAAAAQK